MNKPGALFSVPIECDDQVVLIGIPAVFADLCAIYRTDPLEVLAGFMADAGDISDMDADGFSTGGSDERDMAADYVRRRWSRGGY